MLIANQKPICLIGFAESTILQECNHFISKEFDGPIVVLRPDEFMALPDKSAYQYGAAFTLDVPLRKKVINVIEDLNLDCFTFVHDTVVCYTDDIAAVIGHGSFVSPFCSILLNSKIGRHCVIETYCLISHYSELGENCIVHSGSMIAGKTIIGNNSVLNFKASVLNALTLCDDVVVGAGSMITKNVTVPGYYVGSPARRIGDVKEFNA